MYSRQGISIETTDSSVLKLAKDEIRKAVPKSFALSDNYESFKGDTSNQLPNGAYFRDQFEKLDSKDYVLGWWLIQLLISKGWEPFDSHRPSTFAFHNSYDYWQEVHLKIKYE